MSELDDKLRSLIQSIRMAPELDVEKAISQFKALFLATIKECVPKPRVFKGGLDNGMSDQIHGFNVAISQTLAKAEEVVGK